MKRGLSFLLAFCAAHLTVFAQPKEAKWDVTRVQSAAKEISFTTSEGTWMSLDVSPDGKQIVFDLLGDIYLLPITGGEATLLRGGPAWEIQPRFSPDGSKILFTSDAGGGDNIWLMNTDGSAAKQVTRENFRLLNNATWMPDGNYIVARKHFTSTRSLGAGEMWMYHISGGEGVKLTARKNDQQDVNEPSVSPDGRYLYFSEDVYPGGYFQYNKDPNSQIYQIRRYDFQKGTHESLITGPGGAARPQVSRDGKYLAFVSRVRTQSVLFVRDLETAEEWPVYDSLSKDQQEAWAIFGVYPGFSWMPDNKHLVIWSGGKLKKIAAFPEAGANKFSVSEIPFSVKASHHIVEALRFPQEVSPAKFTAKAIRHAVTSPDGKTLVFYAAGYLWKKTLPSGKPERLTKSTVFEYEPSFSPNGQELLYVTWDDEATGTLVKLQLKTGKQTKLSKEKGIYRMPRFSPDGKKIVYVKERGNEDQGYAYSVNPGVYIANADGTDARRILPSGWDPMFNAGGSRIFYLASGFPNVQYKSVDLQGHDAQLHFTSRYATDFVPSPDNQWVAFRELHNVYIAAFPAAGQALELSAKTASVPVSRVSRDAGINMHWSSDSKHLYWTLGEEYFTAALQNRFSFLEGAPDSIPPIDTVGIRIGLELDTDIPQGTVVFKGARIITMKGEEVIENAVLVVKENRIAEIGREGEVAIPSGAKVIDVKGKTIIPGLVDVHAHVGHFRHGLSPQKHWPYYANLAYGVTTTHDPSTNTEMVFALSELVKSGQMVGPRVFSTGTILYGADGDFKAEINSLDDARSAIRRTMAFGAFSVKSYNQPRREQRQMVIQAAREQQCMVVPEGGSTFFHNMTMILDGHTGIEHNIPVAPIYNDVIQLWKNSRTGYTPTLIVNYGSVNGENYWYQHTNVWENQRLLSYTPRDVIDARARHRTMIPEEEYENGHILTSRSVKKLADEGVKVNVGGHGQIQGIGVHWEIWMLAQGGMSPHEALKAATLNGAEYVGLDSDIGSLEKGKLADLVVLDENPLDNIRNTETIRYVMVNGRLYDPETMHETGNYDRKRSRFYWEMPRQGHFLQLHPETGTLTRPQCSCGTH